VKVLVLSHVFPPITGGSGRWLWELYRRVTGIEVRVAAGDADGAEAFDRASRIPIVRLPLGFRDWGLSSWRGARGYARAGLALNRLISGSRPDVLHCGKCLPEGLLAAGVKQLRGISFSCYVHGEELALARTSRELSVLTRAVIRAATTLIANSAHSKRMLVNDWGVPAEKVVVLHPGVDTTRFVPGECRPEVRARLGWTNRRVLLTVGALQKRKGQDMMIRALPAIRRRCPDVLYAMVGQGWEQTYLEELARAEGVADAVQFLGAPDDSALIEFYQQCDVFALPNRQVGWDFEGFGIAFIEAQACGKPVIAGASGGAPETMRPGETGMLVRAETPEAVADAAVYLLDHPEVRTAMGERARQWVVEQFDWDVLTAQARVLFNGTY